MAKFTQLFRDLAELNQAANNFIAYAEQLSSSKKFNVDANYEVVYIETDSGQKPTLVAELIITTK